jgi:hypothetical protein
VEEPRVRLLVETGEEREVPLAHLAHRLETTTKTARRAPGTAARRRERRTEVPLVGSAEQREDLVPPEPVPVERHARQPGLPRDPLEGRRLPADPLDRPSSRLDDAFLDDESAHDAGR